MLNQLPIIPLTLTRAMPYTRVFWSVRPLFWDPSLRSLPVTFPSSEFEDSCEGVVKLGGKGRTKGKSLCLWGKSNNEMGDEGRVRTMSVELALRREFAYRKKLEMMQSQAKEASKQILEPVLSANERTQMLRQQKDVYKANVEPMPHSKERIQTLWQLKDVSKASVEPMLHSKEVFSRASLTSAPNASGIKRKAPLPAPTILQNPPPVRQLTQTSPLGGLFCDLCQVPCSSPFNLRQHLHGHKHKMKVAMTDLGKNSCVNRVNPRMKWCELCQVCCPNENALEQHFKGKKHVFAVHRTKEENVQRTLQFE